ncbi:MAG: ATP phosphoribosyltransferase regulatory subunit [Clostridia bacterium]|nr:ATP phosphoribosyltransferase regulatory subunit [Clostridia bacterium]
MTDFEKILSIEEWTALKLRALYASQGYRQYKMRKFEQYDLYVQNKDFLQSEAIITFTDTDGRLMALKPDVTLSIIKNSRDEDGTQKVYYYENVYRVAKGTRAFKEIMQVGVECFGEIEQKDLVETLVLAAKSLDAISPSNVLEISHLGIVSGVLDACGMSGSGKKQAMLALGEKNVQALRAVCQKEGLDESATSKVCGLIDVCGEVKESLGKMEEYALNENLASAIANFKGVLADLSTAGVDEKVRIDFSLVGNTNYYSGLTFNGFVEGVPTSVLSGGEYNNLMKKMKRNARAIGFAVYLEGLGKRTEEV